MNEISRIRGRELHAIAHHELRYAEPVYPIPSPHPRASSLPGRLRREMQRREEAEAVELGGARPVRAEKVHLESAEQFGLRTSRTYLKRMNARKCIEFPLIYWYSQNWYSRK